jgi:hypothetical protein
MGTNNSKDFHKQKTSYDHPTEVDTSSGFRFLEVHAPSSGLSWVFVCTVLFCLTVCYFLYKCLIYKCVHSANNNNNNDYNPRRRRRYEENEIELDNYLDRVARRERPSNFVRSLPPPSRILPPLMSSSIVTHAEVTRPSPVQRRLRDFEHEHEDSIVVEVEEETRGKTDAASQTSYILDC